MSAWAIGGAYGISAGLLIYGIESGIIEESLHAPLLMAWAVVGLVGFILGTLTRKKEM